MNKLLTMHFALMLYEKLQNNIINNKLKNQENVNFDSFYVILQLKSNWLAKKRIF